MSVETGTRSPAQDGRAKAIVVGNGRCPNPDRLPPGTLDGARLVVAADGGFRSALALGLRPDCLVGDADSLGAADLGAAERLGIPLRRVPAEKDESDMELAVSAALAAGADQIVIVGGLDGPRVEHTVANVLLLASPKVAGVDVALVDDRSTISALRAESEARTLHLTGRRGDYVSLFAIGGDATEVTTDGLKYPLSAEPLALGTALGLSNEFVADAASVTVRGGVLFVVVTPRDRAGEEELD